MASYQCLSGDEVISSRVSDVRHPTRDSSFYVLRILNVSVNTDDFNHTRDNPSRRPLAHCNSFKNSRYWALKQVHFFMQHFCTAVFTSTWRKHKCSKPEQETQACCWLQSGELCCFIISLVHLDGSRSWPSRWFVASGRGAGRAPWQQLQPWSWTGSDEPNPV